MLFDAFGQPIPGTETQASPLAVPMPADRWGMGFIMNPDGTMLTLRFSAAEGDLMVQDMTPPGGKHRTDHLLVRARPTARGFLTAPGWDEWVEFAASEVAAVEALAEANAQVVAEAEQIANGQ